MLNADPAMNNGEGLPSYLQQQNIPGWSGVANNMIRALHSGGMGGGARGMGGAPGNSNAMLAHPMLGGSMTQPSPMPPPSMMNTPPPSVTNQPPGAMMNTPPTSDLPTPPPQAGAMLGGGMPPPQTAGNQLGGVNMTPPQTGGQPAVRMGGQMGTMPGAMMPSDPSMSAIFTPPPSPYMGG